MPDLKKLSVLLSIPLWELEVAQGQPISNDITVTTIEEATTKYPEQEQFGSYNKAIALHHWRRLSNEALEEAATVDELRRLFAIAAPDEVTRGKILMKRLSLADTFEEVKAVIGLATHNIHVRHIAYDKWRDLTWQVIGSASNLTEAISAYQNSPPERVLQRAALEKCLEFVKTAEDVIRLCPETKETSECREIIFRHWLSLATTSSELIELREFCHSHVDIRNETLQKLISLHQTVAA